ncbi:MAG: nuclear transport factor 2 family protein [Rhizomicrobium sp.]
MGIEQRIEALETRLQAAEDQLEIIRLINTYGPLVDSGESQPAAHLWIEGGVYDMGGVRRAVAYDDIASVYDSDGHRQLINTGCAHLTATPRITLNGDRAEAVAYSMVLLKAQDGWNVWRASANHWTLTRTAEGWRIVERYNRVLDGSEASHETLRRVMR